MRKGVPVPGAHVSPEGVRYVLWAPERSVVEVEVEREGAPMERLALQKGADGFFTGLDPRGRAGDLYFFWVDGTRVPDPASRCQPRTLTGPSQVVDPGAYAWRAADWKRPAWRDRVLYELHIGTFTAEGTFRAAIGRLDALAELGIDTIEIMPVADFEGTRNWGYDGAMLYAPARVYGTPDDLRALVDAAHQRGLAVLLDVVYNHLGHPSDYLAAISSHYFHPTRKTGWGPAFNWDGPDSGPVRRFFVENALYWLEEYRFDGLRLDSTHSIVDDSPRHVIAEIAESGQALGGIMVAEDERNHALVITPRAEGGWGLDAVWADDFHYCVRKMLTGQRESHFGSFQGRTEELVETLQRGWYYRGQYDAHRQRHKGTPAEHLPLERFVFCISNHDQVGNRALGDRFHEVIPPEAYRAVSMLLCLVPYTPMLFMGQEWRATSRFPFFTDYEGERGQKIAGWRRAEFEKYGTNADPGVLDRMPDPQHDATFHGAKLDWAERDRPGHRELLELYRVCLRQRRRRPPGGNHRSRLQVRQVAVSLTAVRWDWEGEAWLLLFGLHAGERAHRFDEDPFLVAPGQGWEALLSSNEARFGGDGVSAVDLRKKTVAMRGPECVLLHALS